MKGLEEAGRVLLQRHGLINTAEGGGTVAPGWAGAGSPGRGGAGDLSSLDVEGVESGV